MTDTATRNTEEHAEVEAEPAPEATIEAVEQLRTRKVRRAEQRVERAQRRAERALEVAESKAAAPEPKRSRLKLLAAIVAGLVIVAAAAWTYWYSQIREQPQPEAAVSLEATTQFDEAIVIRSGVIDLQTLATTTDAAIEVSDGIVTVGVPVVVTDGGSLQIGAGEVRLLSSPTRAVGLVVAGGTLEIVEANVTSWNGDGVDADSSRPRAFISVADAEVTISDSTFAGLGSGEDGNEGLTFGRGTSGSVETSRSTGGYAGLTVTGALDDLRVEDVILTDAITSGLHVASASGVTLTRITASGAGAEGISVSGSSESVRITDSESFANGTAGIQVNGAAGDITLEANRSYRNASTGVAIANTRGVTLHDNSIWSNSGGVFLTGANAGTVLRENTITGNRGAGVEIASAGSAAELIDNSIDHNETGVLIADGSAIVTDNTISENGVGVSVLDTSPSVSLIDNVMSHNYDVGLRLIEPDGLEASGNELMDNEHAAFRVEVATTSAGYMETNEVEAGRYGIEWVFGGYASAEDLADLTPVPDYFFAGEIPLADGDGS